MKWNIEYSRQAIKFAEEHNILDTIKEEITKFLLKMNGLNLNIDVKKLLGTWKGYFRIRKGKIRIIFNVNKWGKSLYIEKIDFRGDVYK